MEWVDDMEIPDQLRRLDQWVRWRIEPRRAGESPSKIPYRPIGQTRAKTDDPHTWGSFELATAWLGIGDMSGIGFVFADCGGLVGIDLDGCRDPTTGQLLDWGTYVLSQFTTTYAEISPSQRGIKIIAGGNLPTDRTGKRALIPGVHCGIEAYQRRRFFCVTGQIIPGHPCQIANCQAALDWLWATWLVPNKPQKQRQLVSKSDYLALASSRLRRAAAYLEKLEPAIQGSNGSSPTYRAACELYRFGLTDSEAMSLLRQYNDRCSPPWSDAELAHKLDDARDEIDEAGEFGVRLLEDRRQRHSANGSAASTGQQTPITTPITVNEADDDPHRLARINLAQYASRRSGRTLHYWRDEWYVWKNQRYQKISERDFRAKLSWVIKQEFDRINLEKLERYEQEKKEGKEVEGEPPFVRKVGQAIVLHVMQATAGMVGVSPDVEPMTWLSTKERRPLVTMENGILDIDALLSGASDYMLPHTPDWFSMVKLPYEFNPEAICPKWDAFLEYNLEMDPERIKILQEWAGYLLLPDTTEQKFMVLEGDGANGKSVYTAAITAMLGSDNVSNQSLETFGVRFALTETIGKLLNACGDCGEIDKVAEGHVKAFTGGDRMFFDRKGVAGINCSPTARLMICCNNRPRFRDPSRGIWRRMLHIQWNVQISQEKRIKGMDKVEWWNRSGELPGILRWAIVGLDRLRRQGGFTDSETMNETISGYQKEANPAKIFFEDFIECGEDRSVVAKFLYLEYHKWAKSSGYIPMSEANFGKEVKRAFPDCVKYRGGGKNNRTWNYKGIGFFDHRIEENSCEEEKTSGENEISDEDPSF